MQPRPSLPIAAGREVVSDALYGEHCYDEWPTARSIPGDSIYRNVVRATTNTWVADERIDQGDDREHSQERFGMSTTSVIRSRNSHPRTRHTFQAILTYLDL